MAGTPTLRQRKFAAWSHIAIGLIDILIAVRDLIAPQFLNVHGRDSGNYTGLWLTAGVLLVASGVIRLRKIHTNPEGITEPAVSTLFGGHQSEAKS